MAQQQYPGSHHRSNRADTGLALSCLQQLANVYQPKTLSLMFQRTSEVPVTKPGYVSKHSREPAKNTDAWALPLEIRIQ